MNHDGKDNHIIGGLSVLLLFSLFAVCVLFVLLFGADAYRRITERDQAAYDRRTCAQYLAAKVRQAEGGGAVCLTFSRQAGDALVLTEHIGGEDYVTWVYCYDGWLRELFSAAGEAFSPDAGEKLLPSRGMSLKLEDGLLSCELLIPGEDPVRLTLALRSGEGAAP